jgi:hypothetical protein
MVDDLEGIFTEAKLNDAFTDKGIAALLDWQFWSEPLFYIITFITIAYIYSLFWAW